MAAIHDHFSVGETALPVCLRKENPNRLVSLWDIVNQFKAGDFCQRIGNFAIFEARFQIESPQKVGVEPWAELSVEFAAQIIHAANDCHDAGFTEAWGEIDRVNSTFDQKSAASCTSAARHIKQLLVAEVGKRRFLIIDKQFSDFVDNQALFGQRVKDEFPSAERDVCELGNCLAAGCHTAAVFHAMRAAEIALRALAADRRVSYPDAALSSKQVGDLLSALDGKLADLRKADAKLWPSKDVKDAQIKFYHSAVAEFRDFNEAWRKHMAHAHEGAFYGPGAASDIVKHVRSAMEMLAEKISENTATPEYWTQA